MPKFATFLVLEFVSVFVEYHEIIILEASNLIMICLSKITTHLFAIVCSQHCSQLDRKTCNAHTHTTVHSWKGKHATHPCTHACARTHTHTHTELWFSVPSYRTVLQIKQYYKQIYFILFRVQTSSLLYPYSQRQVIFIQNLNKSCCFLNSYSYISYANHVFPTCNNHV